MKGGTRPTLKESLLELQSLVEEATTYAHFRAAFLSDYEALYRKYQKTSMTYEEYRKKLGHLLDGRSKQEWISYYDSYLYLLYKKIDFYTDAVRQIVSSQEADEVFPEPAAVRARFLRMIKEDQEAIERRALQRAREEGIFKKHERRAYLAEIEASRMGLSKKLPPQKIEEMVDLEEKASRLAVGDAKKTQEVAGKRRQAIREGRTNIDADLFVNAPTEEASGFDEDADQSLEVKSFWRTGIFGKILRLFFGDRIDQGSFLSKDVTVGTSLLTMERLSRIARDNTYEKENIDVSLLTKESLKLRNILRGKEQMARKAFLIGTVANLAVRKISAWLIKHFPAVSEMLYNGLRLANVRMLSNTYVNVVVLFTLLSGVLGLFFSLIFFSFFGLPFFVVLVRALAFSLISMVITGAVFYGYPFNRIKERRTNIRTNLSFAISHMAAIAGSGVPPFTMFELLAQSPEYGEVTVEVQKIVDYCNLFGYDMIISVKSVAATCPSPDLKEFLSGLVSSIESGGDLKQYLVEKSKEALNNYQLERQKFNEVISTYSDIYTGILIAAPLFFVSSLSLVGLLGGTIGGLDIKFIIGVGIYMVIPAMNIGFISFLEMSQPEV